jgi:hypothetical protein
MIKEQYELTSLRRVGYWEGSWHVVKGQQMNETNVSALARHLFETQGAKAIAEAAQKAAFFEQAGDKDQATLWHRVEAVLREIRGPHQS